MPIPDVIAITQYKLNSLSLGTVVVTTGSCVVQIRSFGTNVQQC